ARVSRLPRRRRCALRLDDRAAAAPSPRRGARVGGLRREGARATRAHLKPNRRARRITPRQPLSAPRGAAFRLKLLLRLPPQQTETLQSPCLIAVSAQV